MTRKVANRVSAETVTRRAPVLKYQEACKLADKNARTIMKISRLLDIASHPGYATADPKRLVEKCIEKLKNRMNRRLAKLAKWSDSSAEDRHAEFRPSLRTLQSRPHTSNYSRPAPSYPTSTFRPLPTPAVPSTTARPFNRPSLTTLSQFGAKPSS